MALANMGLDRHGHFPGCFPFGSDSSGNASSSGNSSGESANDINAEEGSVNEGGKENDQDSSDGSNKDDRLNPYLHYFYGNLVEYATLVKKYNVPDDVQLNRVKSRCYLYTGSHNRPFDGHYRG